MKLDATDLRYVSNQEFRVLTAVEMGSKNHEVVPSSLAAQISGLHHSGINKLLGSLAKRKLIARVQNTKYDGYRLTYGGYDFLALRAFSKRDSVSAVGRRIGVGKESDIYIVSSPENESRVLKIHRLGRISFRAIKEKRDYMGKRKSASWMYMSRLAAAKEYAFMQILHSHGFPVPEPIDQARHCIVMSLIDAFPLRQIAVLPPRQVPLLYSALMKLIVRLARAGLIHGDFNEFNLLIKEVRPEGSDDEDDDVDDPSQKGPRGRGAQPVMKEYADGKGDKDDLQLEQGQILEKGKGFERVVQDPNFNSANNDDEDSQDGSSSEDEEDDDELDQARVVLEDGVTVEPILIDFPQMVSIQHENAEYYFDRDVDCVRRFFRKRFRYESDEYPRFKDLFPDRVPGVEKDNAASETGGPGSDAPRLDILAKASGYGGGSKQDKELETFMAELRLKATQPGAGSSDELSESSEAEVDEDEDGKDDDDDDNASSQEEDSEAEHSHSDADSSSSEKIKRPKAKRATRPSRGAARKALADGDDSALAQIVASDRARAARRNEKHHGKRAHAGKAGRAHAGGKAKTSKSRLVSDNLVF